MQDYLDYARTLIATGTAIQQACDAYTARVYYANEANTMTGAELSDALAIATRERDAEFARLLPGGIPTTEGAG